MIERVLIQAELEKQLTLPARVVMPLQDAVVSNCPEEMVRPLREIYELMHQAGPDTGSVSR